MPAKSSSSSSVPPLNKYLASTEKKTRDKAIKTLSVFLSDETRDELPKSEMTRLWKGIFYCFWMSDKPLVQQALASELAELVLTTTNSSSKLSFLNGFWETMVREWNGIDRLRLDKYLMLTDLFDGRVPVGLVYHIADVYLEELEKALRSSTRDTIKPVPLALILSPFFNLAAQTPLGTIYQHLQSSLFDPLLLSCSSSKVTSEDENDGETRARKRRRVNGGSSDMYPSMISNACLDDASIEVKLPRRETQIAEKYTHYGRPRMMTKTIRMKSSLVHVCPSRSF
ncbi:Nop52-domain-containing protein [Lentinula edodes]|uniref:Nop52-domain-containing protein n=1 Tax=Lentinula edodes TaxID=5353 RepID=A0A1Q3DVE8_LENED|nr:Nop52-domain-containing protein [Lentinula edodes]